MRDVNKTMERAMAELNDIVGSMGFWGKTITWRYTPVYVSKNRMYKYGWTTKRNSDGKFQSFVYKPVSKDKWIMTKVRDFNKRVSAERNAYRKAHAHERRLKHDNEN